MAYSISYAEALRRGYITEADMRALRLTTRAGPNLSWNYSPPQAMLSQALERLYPGEVQHEYKPLEHRKFCLDNAFPAIKLGIECDGWSAHKWKVKYQTDRKKDQVLAEYGWLVLRFPAVQVTKDVERVLANIAAVRAERGGEG